jgi:hypothetical protein
MRRLLLLLAVAAALAQAQTPVNVQFGGLACAAIRRPSAQVQTYCYLYPPSPNWVLVENRITTVTPGGVMLPYGRCVARDPQDTTKCASGGSITWQFVLENDGSITYKLTYSGSTPLPITGTLP